ncbi:MULTISPECIES: histone H1 [unclassified Methylibium]|uniref:histone H1 n=1 Tax=unclassified Methylibium TaxID=2633235 RepID=UPI0003F47370|nr:MULTISPECIES: histone H1 [unclassified Methylibium]EWS54452.1 hypothetical protein X551_02744 [Methylibium sp. T29]EWS58547.1 hypothetical protein Y694_03584 [Methylibium sp. T29-B]
MATKKDFTQVAHTVFLQATDQIAPIAPTARQEAGSKGGKKGGKSRMNSLTAEQREELARRAATARWSKKAPGSKAGASTIKSKG